MLVSRILPFGLLLGFLTGPVAAADVQQNACLTKSEQRIAVADRKAISLAQAVKSLREHGHRAELVGAKLCHHGDNLAYMLTLLARSGKVIVATVDATTGDVSNGR